MYLGDMASFERWRLRVSVQWRRVIATIAL